LVRKILNVQISDFFVLQFSTDRIDKLIYLSCILN